MKYTGEKCFNCGEQFGADDDVVVCPDCGTPYHRHCYKEAGKCLNDALHESKKSWQSEADIKAEKSKEKVSVQYVICPRCFHKNDPAHTECSECGFVLPPDKSANDAAERLANYASAMEHMDVNKQYFGFDPKEDFGSGVNLGEVAQFVNANTLYYLPIFKRMKDLGSKISFNIICLFCPYFFFANRKMWAWTFLSLFAAILLNLPDMIYYVGSVGADTPFLQGAAKLVSANENFIRSMMDICSAADWIIRIIACLFGNWLYFRFSVRSVSKEKHRFGGPVSPQRLGAKGGVSPLNVLVTALILAVLSFALMFVVMFIFVYLQQIGIL